ncbi:MAG: hypothetical protein ACKVP0_10755 [Pirellulaceae bacterium]
MTPQPLRVIKVGGSLLRHQPDAQAKDTIAALKTWLGLQTPAANVLIAGGGEFGDVIRRADAAHNLGEEAAHWLCVDALSVTAQLLGAVVGLPVVTRPEELPQDIPTSCVFDPAPFFHDCEFRLFAAPLPHTWAVTSDSIAARVAEYLSARELVLLKSCLPGAARTGYVDDYFPVAAANLSTVRCVNLRSASFEQVSWESRS